jgi:hypothetical protein
MTHRLLIRLLACTLIVAYALLPAAHRLRHHMGEHRIAHACACACGASCSDAPHEEAPHDSSDDSRPEPDEHHCHTCQTFAALFAYSAGPVHHPFVEMCVDIVWTLPAREHSAAAIMTRRARGPPRLSA